MTAQSTLPRSTKPTDQVAFEEAMRRLGHQNHRRLLLCCGLVLAAVVLSILALGVGAVTLGPGRVLATIAGYGYRNEYLVVVELRLPRVLTALLVGAQFAVSGALLQTITRNELASPATVGVTGGAALGALGVLAFASAGTIATLLPIAAFAGALLAGATSYLVARRKGLVNPERLALIGVALGGLMMALIQLVIVMTLMGADVQSSLRWLTGSLWGVQWLDVLRLIPFAVVGLVGAWVMGPSADVIELGDDIPRSLGSRLEFVKIILLGLALGLAGSAVAVGGSITFVGLVAPHLARRLVGPRHRLLLPTAASLGALLVVVADTVGRSILPPTEIPVGLFTAVIGAPYFLYLIRRGMAT